METFLYICTILSFIGFLGSVLAEYYIYESVGPTYELHPTAASTADKLLKGVDFNGNQDGIVTAVYCHGKNYRVQLIEIRRLAFCHYVAIYKKMPKNEPPLTFGYKPIKPNVAYG